MAHLPQGASLIDNPVSAAPGFRIGNVFVMAGVPSIMRAMFDGLKGTLAGGRPVLSLPSAPIWARASSPPAWARCSSAMPISRSAAIPSSARASSAPVSCCAAPSSGGWIAAAAEELRALIRELGAEPIEGEPSV